MLVVDTNVLIYAADVGSEFHEVCVEFLNGRRADPSPTYLTWNICYEFLRVTSHPRVFRSPWRTADAFAFLRALFATDSFSLLRPSLRHADILEQTIAELPDLRGNPIHDMHTAVLMREHGVTRVCSRDTDFHRFPFIEVIDPLRMG